MANWGAWHRLATLAPEELPDTHSQTVAGTNAESIVAQFVADLRNAGWPFKVMQSRMVTRPRNDSGSPTNPKNLEIDVVAVGEVILILEVKGWGGSLEVEENGTFVQVRSNGETIRHGPVGEKLKLATRYLQGYLDGFGLQCPPETLIPLIVFTNDRIKFHDSVQSRVPFVVRKADILGQLPQRDGFFQYLFKSFISLLYTSKAAHKLNASMQEAVVKALGRLRTWDVVIKSNGEELRGNVQYLRANGVVYDRRTLESVSVQWSKSKLWAFAISTFGMSVGTAIIVTRDKGTQTIAIDGACEDNMVSILCADSRLTMDIPLNRIAELNVQPRQ
jgi:hypothetical protein